MDIVFDHGLRFPWENLLFEAGFIALFAPALVPWSFDFLAEGGG